MLQLGMHLRDGVDSHQDLIHSGLKLIPAKSFYRRIVEWKMKGLPADFLIERDQEKSVTDTSRPGTVSEQDGLQTTTPVAPTIAVSTTAPVATTAIPELPSSTPSTVDDTPNEDHDSKIPHSVKLEQDFNTARWCSDTLAAARIQQLADSGDHLAQMQLSRLYEVGCKSFLVDPKKAAAYATMALPWISQQADAGNASAQCLLGQALISGVCLQKDLTEGARFIQLAAKQDHTGAQVALGWCFLFGLGVPKFEEEGVRYSKLAAQKGSILALANLGLCYQHGAGVTKSEEEAFRLYQRAARENYSVGQHFLANCYYNGLGVDRDEKLALRYYHLAAQQNHISSQEVLGFFYEHGGAVTKNHEVAVRYYTQAASQGSEYAIEALQRIALLANE